MQPIFNGMHTQHYEITLMNHYWNLINWKSNTIGIFNPICVEYLEDDIMKKSAVSFISSDSKHDHEQIQKFEQRLFEIIHEKVCLGIKNWARFSNSYSTQFKLQYCVADLSYDIGLLNITQASFHYSKSSNESKNSSESIGSANSAIFAVLCWKILTLLLV